METERLWILLAKKKSNEATAEELAELDQLLFESESSRYNHEVIEKLWEKPLEFLPEMRLGENNWKNISDKIKPPQKVFSLSIVSRWMAAAVVLIFISTSIFFYYKGLSNKAPTSINNVSEVITKPALKRNFYLPDGTHVWLNSNSKIAYTNSGFGTTKREVVLTGEAFFDVVKNAAVPFVIHAGVVNITVKGTAFNVKAYPGEKNIETTLLRGLIEITTKQEPSKKILVNPNEKIIIPATITTVKNKEIDDTAQSLFTIVHVKKNTAEILPETAWLKNKLEFNNQTFEELAPEMESWFSINIRFENNDIKTRRFSGVIEKETLEEMLKAMQLSYYFNYQIKNNTVTIQ